MDVAAVEVIAAILAAMITALPAAVLASRRTTERAAEVLREHDVDDRSDFANLQASIAELRAVVSHQGITDNELGVAIESMARSVETMADTTRQGFEANLDAHNRLGARLERNSQLLDELNDLHRNLRDTDD